MKREGGWNILVFFLIGAFFFNSTLIQAGVTHVHRDQEHQNHHDHAEQDEKENTPLPSNVGKGKAIQAASLAKGLRLSERAKQTLGLKFRSIETKSPFRVDSKAIVYHEADVGIYRMRDGWIKLIDVHIIKKNQDGTIFDTRELVLGDQIVTDGVPLLRVAELNAWSEPGESEEH
jgi:hypothetical protein